VSSQAVCPIYLWYMPTTAPVHRLIIVAPGERYPKEKILKRDDLQKRPTPRCMQKGKNIPSRNTMLSQT
jgi:hypothetical protein